MEDFRLVAARRLVWNKDAWREPAFLGLVIDTVKRIATDEAESPEARAEAEMLVKKLYLAGKAPKLA